MLATEPPVSAVAGSRAFGFRRNAKELDEQGNTRMTLKYVQQLCKEQKLYNTPELNDKLYLHFKGFAKIENLEAYTGVRSLWLEGNGISRIENLSAQTDLRCLFLQQNCIEEIENLSALTQLDTLALDNNLLKRINGEGLKGLNSLKTLQVAKNLLRTREDLEGLMQAPGITILDLSGNKLEDPAIVDVLAGLPNLAVLNLMSNPVIAKIPNYRRVLISRIPTLTYLDDRPVFDKERLAVEAWARGGVEAEREERERQRNAEKEEQNRNFEALRDLQSAARARRLEKYGPDPEPTFTPALTKLRDSMLEKISPAAHAAEPSSDSNPEKARKVNGAPIRQFTQMSTAGHRISGGDDDTAGWVPEPMVVDEAEEDDNEEEETIANHDIPPLEDASDDLTALFNGDDAAPSLPTPIGTHGWATRRERAAAAARTAGSPPFHSGFTSGIHELADDAVHADAEKTFVAAENPNLTLRSSRNRSGAVSTRDPSAEPHPTQDNPSSELLPLLALLESSAAASGGLDWMAGVDMNTPPGPAAPTTGARTDRNADEQDHAGVDDDGDGAGQRSPPTDTIKPPGLHAEHLATQMFRSAPNTPTATPTTRSTTLLFPDTPAPPHILHTSVPAKRSGVLASRRLIEEIEAREPQEPLEARFVVGDDDEPEKEEEGWVDGAKRAWD
ncbi:uncharacterized protein EV422DRAFT_562599 [Fimicolochytrium jonesii]|uniref:uncharacterized protein n=1 Tax=Fimicolochytrium jonesii TaxID=1396493 RepID=UPI0022FEFDD8|nr:uncharacterized protein EV422DRAFT_562599 [Fimicolochytrium jonesii]KAI8826540.1 hypothetical protein EV422DRAFT_562599 [Fimicolochytrium jonesii]